MNYDSNQLQDLFGGRSGSPGALDRTSAAIHAWWMDRLLWLPVFLWVLACKPAPATRCAEPERGHQGADTGAPGPTAARAYEASVPAAQMVPMTVLNVLSAEGGAAVLLRESGDDGHVVPIFIGATEGTAIALRLEGETFVRPLTHDLLEAVLRAHGLRIGRVEIHDLIEGTFHGRVVILDPDGRVTQLDARASDSIALALGAGAEVFMARHVVSQAGVTLESLGLELATSEPPTGDPPR